jgi:catechol 2,3-dioxygenase-like lactoylglutathione lyase family enzyme
MNKTRTLNTYAQAHIYGASQEEAMATEKMKALKAHIAIHVQDVTKSIEFYRKLFGIEPCKVRTGYAKFDVSTPPLNFTLNEGAMEARGALSHLGIQVASTGDVLAVRRQWHERGLSTRDEMKTDCCYALQDKTWVRDPDGNEWEVFVVLEDDLPEKSTAEKSCCAPDYCAPAAP